MTLSTIQKIEAPARSSQRGRGVFQHGKDEGRNDEDIRPRIT